MQASSIKLVKKINSQAGQISLKSRQSIQFKTWQLADPEASILHQGILGSGELNKQLENYLLEMKVGDIWQFQIDNGGQVKELCVQITKAGEIIEEAKVDEYAKAQKLKQEGNILLKDKKLLEAIEKYEQSHKILQYTCEQKSVELKLSIMSNMALANLNCGRSDQCLKWCSKYLQECFEPNKKVVYRKVSAYKNMKNWEEAKKLLHLAKQRWVNDVETLSDFQKLGEQIEKQQKSELAKEKKIYSNMFG